MSKPRLLLADDNIAVAKALRRLLDIDCDVVGVVHDGAELVNAARELRPDVIVTDLSMPRMNGLEAVRQLRREGTHAKIIFLTMYQEACLSAEALRLGASAYLPKHTAGEELISTIYRVMGVTAETERSTPIT